MYFVIWNVGYSSGDIICILSIQLNWVVGYSSGDYPRQHTATNIADYATSQSTGKIHEAHFTHRVCNVIYFCKQCKKTSVTGAGGSCSSSSLAQTTPGKSRPQSHPPKRPNFPTRTFPQLGREKHKHFEHNISKANSGAITMSQCHNVRKDRQCVRNSYVL